LIPGQQGPILEASKGHDPPIIHPKEPTMANAFPYRPVQLTEDISAVIHYAPERNIQMPWLHLSMGCMTMSPTCTEKTVSALRALADHLEEAFRLMGKRAAIEAAMADPSPAEDAAMDALESALNMVRPSAQVFA
jgi:hypothetical protein